MNWREFATELMTPSDFKNDAYGELTNQLSHTFLGVVIAVLTCAAFGAAFGEMPYRIYVIGGIAVAYLLIEIKQHWSAGDSGFDWLMVMFGSLMPMVALREIEPQEVWYLVSLSADFRGLLAVFGVWVLTLGMRVKARL